MRIPRRNMIALQFSTNPLYTSPLGRRDLVGRPSANAESAGQPAFEQGWDSLSAHLIDYLVFRARRS